MENTTRAIRVAALLGIFNLIACGGVEQVPTISQLELDNTPTAAPAQHPPVNNEADSCSAYVDTATNIKQADDLMPQVPGIQLEVVVTVLVTGNHMGPGVVTVLVHGVEHATRLHADGTYRAMVTINKPHKLIVIQPRTAGKCDTDGIVAAVTW